MARSLRRELGTPSTPFCPECGSPFRRTLVPFRHGGRLLGTFPADICANGHEYFTEESGAAIEAAARIRRVPERTAEKHAVDPPSRSRRPRP